MSITSNSVERRVGVMRKCNEVMELISLYIDGVLDAKSEAKLLEHVKTCKSCKQELDETKAMVGLYKNIEEVELPADFKEQLHQKLLEERNKEISSPQRFVLRHSKLIKLCSSAAAIAIVAFAARGFFGGFKSFDKSELANELADNRMMARSANDFAGQTEAKNGTDMLDSYNNTTTDAASETGVNSIEKSSDDEFLVNGKEALGGSFQHSLAMMAMPEAPPNRADIIITVSEPEAEMEKLNLCIIELGASAVTKGMGAENLAEPDKDGQNDGENDFNNIRNEYKVLNTNYSKFINCLNNNFPTLSVTKDVEIDSINARIAEIEKTIIEIDKQLASLDFTITENSEKSNELIKTKEQMTAEQERLNKIYEYIIVSVELKKINATEPDK